MMSKNSFLVSARENNKRRIWVWSVSLLTQLACYPGILIVYLSRINFWHEDNAYSDPGHYRLALQDASADALGFQPACLFSVFLLGAIIAIQGFSYLYDRKKVDLYHSVPVSGKRRFLVIYTNGILIYLLPNILSLVIGCLIAAVQGAMCVRVLAEIAMGMLFHLLYFLIVYHIAILSVMLTGHIIITLCAFGTFSLLGYLIYVITEEMKQIFFATADTTFVEAGHTFSILVDYKKNVYVLKYAETLSEVVKAVLPVYGKWVLYAVILFILVWFCYAKRPAEAAGRAIAFPVIRPFVKVAVCVPFGLYLAYFVYDYAYYNVPIMIFALILGTLFCGIVMEVIYEFDLFAALKHWASTWTAVAASFIVLCIYLFDIFGYDDYIPDADQVESIAIEFSTSQNYWEWSEDMQVVSHMNQEHYLSENMFLTDVGAVCELAKKSQDSLLSYKERSYQWDMTDPRRVSVLYRLKSGREVSRRIEVDFADPSNEELINRIIGTKEYREGVYQIVKAPDILDTVVRQKSLELYYENGAIICKLSDTVAQKLREAWMLDMEQFDFSLAGKQRPCGQLRFGLQGSYIDWILPVYECFDNTIALLEAQNAYYPVTLRAEDIERLEITNYHNEEVLYDASVNQDAFTRNVAEQAVATEPVTEIFDDPDEIAEILTVIYPRDLDAYWVGSRTFDDNYYIEITFKRGTDRPYSVGYYHYRFIDGMAPAFVAERTALPDK